MHPSASVLADFETCARDVSRICRPWQLVSQQRRSFRGRIRNFTAASLNVTELELDRSRMQPQSDTTAAGSSRYYSLLLQIRGDGRVCSGRGEGQLRAGDLVLVDSTSATAVETSDATLQYALNFFSPGDVLRLDAARWAAGQPVSCKAGPAALLRDSLLSMVRNAEALRGLDLRTYAIDLLLEALCGAPDSTHRDRDLEPVNVDSLVRHIDAHLDDSALCPRQLAVALGVSLRALYRITSAAGLTPAGLIWTRRLQLARQRLASEQQESITSIAFQSGFKDSGHFSRAFRRVFGASPSAMRKGWQQ